ncbi:hypothetical protein [Salinibacillus xinjiangensis]|uniref:Uncharacterized protein n=1 Tax=Salinibacillus xinjiangensis TaxID=1229268 RepID=A0A6G1X8G3_9BACI|nr:hypothetical protein [Salinibacillus xinjiangensis]MRG87232.1 hypothetical protein [Salinibacillus xinjiangensis]
MSKLPSLAPTLRWLRKNRFKKKLNLIKMSIRTVIDLTIAIYLLGFGFIWLVILRDQLLYFQPYFDLLEGQQSTVWVFTIFIALLIRGLILSFRDPGIYITSTEFQLSLLPFSRMKIWAYSLFERLVLMTVKTFLFLLILWVMTPLNFDFITLLFITIWIGNVTGISIQWRAFQIETLKHVLTIVLSGIVLIAIRYLVLLNELSGSLILWISWFAGILLAISLFTVHSLIYTDWTKVVSFSDVKVWNMMIVQKLTKITIKPPQKFHLFTKIFQGKRARRPFPYDLSVISVRLWRHFFKEQLGIILQSVGVMLLLILILGSQGTWQLGVSIALSIMIITQVMGSMFMYQFEQPIMSAIPWQVGAWFRSYQKWYVALVVVLTLAYTGMLYFHNLETWMIISNACFYAFWIFFDLELSVFPKVRLLTDQVRGNDLFFLVRIVGALAVYLSIYFGWISLIAIGIMIFVRIKKGVLMID